VRQRSSVLVEIAWLAYFFAIFVIVVYLMVIFVVPHHFNDKVAIVLAALIAGVAMIGTRAWWSNRTKKR
jgi:ABC-type iron transport system FetAB permease component